MSDTPPVTRRRERAADDAFRFALFRDAHGDALARLAPPLRDELLRQQFAGQDMSYRAAGPGVQFDIVEIDGEPVGRVVVASWEDEIRLVDVALLRAARGRGLGAALIRTLQGEAGVAGLPLRLSVMRDNAGARRFYARLGFVEEGGDAVSLALRWDP